MHTTEDKKTYFEIKDIYTDMITNLIIISHKL
jgi:hypothetical protein